MARWFSEAFPETSELSVAEHELRKKIVEVMARFTREMEGYSYFGSNPGIAEDDYADVADALMAELDLNDKPMLQDE